MKLACVLLLVLLGFMSASSFSIKELEKDGEEEITSLADLIQKSRTLKKVMAAVEGAMEGEHKDHKRFLESVWDTLKKAGTAVFNGVKSVYNKAKDAVSKFINGDEFDNAVQLLGKYISSATKDTQCEEICKSHATSSGVLHFLENEANKVCPQICEATMAKIQELTS